MRRLSMQGLWLFVCLGGCARSSVGELELVSSGTDAASDPASAGDAANMSPAADAGLQTDAGRTTGEPDAAVVPPGRDGKYAARRVYQQTQHINGSLFGLAINGNLLNTHTVYSLVDIGSDGSFREKACGAHIDSKDGDGASQMFESTITLNPAIFENAAPVEHRIIIDETSWQIPTLFQPLAWMAASSSDPIPTSASDPRVFDLDQDGQPGLTVTISDNAFASGQIYAVQSVRYGAEGVFNGELLDGQDFDIGEQEVLGGTIVSTMQMVAPAGNSSTNRMHLVKLKDGNLSLTCGQLVGDPGALFPPHPVTP